MRVSSPLTLATLSHIATTVVMALFMCLAAVFPSFALEPVSVSRDDIALDITSAVDAFLRPEGTLKISTAPDAEGIVRRIEVRSKNSDGISYWAVFALANNSDEQIDRLIVAPHYRMVGSSLFWPDLDTSRISSITPSEGFSLDRQKDSTSDVFLITLDPGAVITLIAEQNTQELPKLFLWEPSTYKDTTNSYTLYHGIVLGIAGLLAMFLTILFVVKGSAMFPATAALAWGVLAYACVDFGFWNKIITTPDVAAPLWRAATEVFLAGSLVVFVYAYLSLNRWHRNFVFAAVTWVLVLVILMGVAVFEPGIASGIARASIALTVAIGLVLLPILSFKYFDRAIMLVPTWILLTAWALAAGLTISGQIQNDIVQPALTGGLVLLVLLLSFTVMQHAFSGGVFAQGLVSDSERSALALVGAGDVIWDWDVARDRVTLGENIVSMIGAERSILNTKLNSWQKIVHANDRDRFSATLSALLEHKRGKISQTFRILGGDGLYHWFQLRARPLLNPLGDVSRCIGTLTDITGQKRSEERLLQDSIRDNLTGLENREMFVARLGSIIALARNTEELRPTVFSIDLDNFSEINREYGYSAGDNILLSVSRRLSKLLRNGDSLARISGDQFVLMLISGSEPKQIANFADAIQTAINSPINYGGNDFTLSASIGLASWTTEHEMSEQLMRDSELARSEAKRLGGNSIVTFQPSFRTSKDDTVVLIEALRQAVKLDQIKVLYQPITDLQDRVTSGFEALVRWEHPRLGKILPAEFVPIAERSGLINQIGFRVLEIAARDFAQMQQETGKNIFVSVNISSRELLRSDFVAEISTILQETGLPPALLKIEVTESMVMTNPEHATQILSRIKALGVGISLDDFGTGYSSLSYLLRFPFDTIKIDKSFVQARMQHERLVILRSIVGLAHSLNQRIVAEGVEYESDVSDLIQLGCEYAQGYLFGEPSSLDEARQLIQEETTQQSA
jgi:diguanylate cyclase (GGDEF)-like protein/PAS domain S-box-containing protein